MQAFRNLCFCVALRKVSLLAAIVVSLPAAAAYPKDFFGSFMNTNPPAAPAPPCGGQVINKNDPPLYKSAGFSNIGDFSFNLLQCLFPTPSGSIQLDFGGGNTLSGSWGSTSVTSGTPLLFQVTGDAVLTSGTGSFAGVSGWFKANGYLDRRDSAIADSAFVFRGQLVPEPSTYALWLAGACALVFVIRRRRA